MSFDRIPRRLVLISLVGLAGCGFVPVYGQDEGLRARVDFETDETVAGYRLRERLEERLGRSDAPQYLLKTNVRSRQRSAAITSEGDTLRLNIIGTATWTFVATASGESIAEGEVEAFTSYSASASTIATQATRDDAEARLSVMLADLIVSRLLILAPERTR